MEAMVPSILLVVFVLLAGIVLAPATADAVRTEAVMKTPKQQPPTDGKPKTRHGADKTRKVLPPKDAKKDQDETVTPNRGTVDAIGVIARGQTIDIAATALRSGQTCTLQLFYADKQGPKVRDVVPDKNKRCTFNVTVPARPGVVGEAKIVVVFSKATSGKRDGNARQVFTIY